MNKQVVQGPSELFEFENIIIRKTSYGYGLFALKDLKKGSCIYICIFSEIPKNVIYSYTTKEGLFVQDDSRYYCYNDDKVIRYNDIFINHSCDSNVSFNKLEDYCYQVVASKDIKNGEEITCDYNRFFWDMDEYLEDSGDRSFKCLCGSKNCHGYIRGFKFLDQEIQKNLINTCFHLIKDKYYSRESGGMIY